MFEGNAVGLLCPVAEGDNARGLNASDLKATFHEVAPALGLDVLSAETTEANLHTNSAGVNASSVCSHSTTRQTLELLPREEGRNSSVALTNPKRRSSQRRDRIDWSLGAASGQR